MTRPVNAAVFKALWHSKVPIGRIAAEIAVSRPTVYRIADRLALPSRDPVQRALITGEAPGAITLAKLRCLAAPFVEHPD